MKKSKRKTASKIKSGTAACVIGKDSKIDIMDCYREREAKLLKLSKGERIIKVRIAPHE